MNNTSIKITKINSTKNEFIKKLVKLKDKKNILKEKKIIVEGKNIINEHLSNLEYLLITNDNLEIYKDKIKPKKLIIVSEEIINQLTSYKTNKGVVGILKINPKKYSITDFLNFKKIILLDSINNPKNLGVIARTAKGFQFEGIILLNDSTSFFNEKAITSSQGEILDFPIIHIKKRNDIISVKKQFNMYLFDNKIESIDLTQVKFAIPMCLAFGNESNGFSQSFVRVLSSKELFVKIKIDKIDSLNIASSVAIAAFESTK